MKKSMILGVMMVLFGWQMAWASNDKPISPDQLPAKAKAMIEQYFPGEKIAFAKQESELFETRYEVVLEGSAKIEFLGNGEWEEIDCRYKAVPEALIPPQLMAEVKARYPEAQVREIKRENGRHEVKLNNGLELLFNRKHQLVDIDD